MGDIILEYLIDLIDPFLNPQKRVFVGYLASALLIALCLQFFIAWPGVQGAFKHLFNRKVWLSASAKADYKILLINNALMMGIAPRLISKLALATFVFESLHLLMDGRAIVAPDAPGWLIAALFTLSMFLTDDVSKYLVHRALHHWPVLWAFHRVHHSAETLTPFSVYRTHPVEAVIFSLRSIIVQALLVAVFMFFFGPRADLLTILGANAFLFVFNAAGSNLRHSHVWLSYGPVIERIFISPAQHQIHHSVHQRHHDRNFGAVLAVWDWVGGSLTLAHKDDKIRFGVNDAGANEHSLYTLFVAPCIAALGAVSYTLFKDKTNMTDSFFTQTPPPYVERCTGCALWPRSPCQRGTGG